MQHSTPACTTYSENCTVGQYHSAYAADEHTALIQYTSMLATLH
jgi:hypothetical protein